MRLAADGQTPISLPHLPHPPCPLHVQIVYFYWGAGSLGIVVLLRLASLALSCVCCSIAAWHNGCCSNVCCYCCDDGCCGHAWRVMPLSPSAELEADRSWQQREQQWKNDQKASSMASAALGPRLDLLPTARPALQTIAAQHPWQQHTRQQKPLPPPPSQQQWGLTEAAS